MTTFVLRPARSTDAGRVGAILSEFIDQTPWMPRIHTRAEDLGFAGDLIDRGWVTVAEFHDRVVGFSARDDDMIHALYVDAAHRGQGCGETLLSQMKDNASTLTLWTFQSNDRAQSFYARHGFEEVERTDGARNDEKLPDMRFFWKQEVT